MVNLRTEKIRCILCNKDLTYVITSINEFFICSECQAYFCLSCRQAVVDYPQCPAASLLGVRDHKLKFVKILPSKKPLNTTTEEKSTKIKILPRKEIKILEDKKEDKS